MIYVYISYKKGSKPQMKLEQKRLPITVTITYSLQMIMQKLATDKGNSVSHEYNLAIEKYVEQHNNNK